MWKKQRTWHNRVLVFCFLAGFCAVLNSCGGSSMDGTYANENLTLVFRPNGEVQVTSPYMMGLGVDLEYKVQDDRVLIGTSESPGLHYDLKKVAGDTLECSLGILKRVRSSPSP